MEVGKGMRDIDIHDNRAGLSTLQSFLLTLVIFITNSTKIVSTITIITG